MQKKREQIGSWEKIRKYILQSATENKWQSQLTFTSNLAPTDQQRLRQSTLVIKN